MILLGSEAVNWACGDGRRYGGDVGGQVAAGLVYVQVVMGHSDGQGDENDIENDRSD
jgi:hypothetical protein